MNESSTCEHGCETKTITGSEQAPMTASQASFPHESHLDPARWPQLVERGEPVPGWVQRGSQVKAINGRLTIATYHGVPQRGSIYGHQPLLPYGSSWSNLDHCGGWQRDWVRPDGSQVDSDLDLVERVLAGRKLCGQAIAIVDGSSPHAPYHPALADIEALVAAAPEFDLRIEPHPSEGLVFAWVAPRRHLSELVGMALVADFYDWLGWELVAEAVWDFGDTYLPDASDFSVKIQMLTGLLLGYPPASTAALPD
jgi:hypothetical protein